MQSRCIRKDAAAFVIMEIDMKWTLIPIETILPEQFDLSEVSMCMAAPYSGPNSLNMSGDEKWSFFVDVLTTCPVNGTPLPEAALYTFKALGIT